MKAQACLDACRESATGLLINFGGSNLDWSLLVHLYLHQVQAEPAQVLFARKESRMNKDKVNEMPNYDELFKKFCLKQNPDEKVSGQAAFFILKFVEFLKEHGGESPADNSPEVEQPVFMQDFAPGANIEYGVRKKRRFRLERRMAKHERTSWPA